MHHYIVFTLLTFSYVFVGFSIIIIIIIVVA